MKLAVHRRARTLAITDATLSEVGEHAELTLYYSSNGPSYIRSNAALMAPGPGARPRGLRARRGRAPRPHPRLQAEVAPASPRSRLHGAPSVGRRRPPSTMGFAMPERATFRVKTGLAEMLKGGVIMDVTDAEQAKIAEDTGACAVMALERVPADIRAEGGVARMSNPADDQGDPGGGDDPGDGEGPDRPLRRGPGPPVPRGRLHRRVGGADAGRRVQPHRQVRLRGAVRLRRHQPRRGAAPARRGRGDDPLEGRGRDRQHRRGGPPHARDHRRDQAPRLAAPRAARRRREGAPGAARRRPRGRRARLAARSRSSAPVASPPPPTPR